MKPTLLLLVALLFGITNALGCAKKHPDEGVATPSESTTTPAAAAPPAAPASADPPAAGTLLAVGARAPAFTAQAHDGTTVDLAALAGKSVVLYFYPKDETPGCTVEAQKFRDDKAQYDRRNAVVLGVSLDNVDSHKSFATHHELPFLLIADTDGKLAAKYGVSTEGGYARRVTYVIGPDGVIAHVFADVDVQGHSEAVLAALDSIGK